MTGAARWELGAGADRWNPGAPKPPGDGGDSRTFATARAGIRLITAGERVDARIRMRSWLSAGDSFHSGQALVTARSSSQAIGTVVVGAGGVSAVTASAPGDQWFAGDTGRARSLLLRAHPILSEGARFRTERLGRLLDAAQPLDRAVRRYELVTVEQTIEGAPDRRGYAFTTREYRALADSTTTFSGVFGNSDPTRTTLGGESPRGDVGHSGGNPQARGARQDRGRQGRDAIDGGAIESVRIPARRRRAGCGRVARRDVSHSSHE